MTIIMAEAIMEDDPITAPQALIFTVQNLTLLLPMVKKAHGLQNHQHLRVRCEVRFQDHQQAPNREVTLPDLAIPEVHLDTVDLHPGAEVEVLANNLCNKTLMTTLLLFLTQSLTNSKLLCFKNKKALSLTFSYQRVNTSIDILIIDN